MESINSKEYNKNPNLQNLVEPENDLKNMLVEYVGQELNPENQKVTVEMIVEVMAKEFPEFVLAMAEENWIRGYEQALVDVDVGMKLEKEENEKKRSCKLCEE
tara:strand:- start:626 stop:934 length:309 start_codon:yes stop_codon:yes gene_type:complete